MQYVYLSVKKLVMEEGRDDGGAICPLYASSYVGWKLLHNSAPSTVYKQARGLGLTKIHYCISYVRV